MRWIPWWQAVLAAGAVTMTGLVLLDIPPLVPALRPITVARTRGPRARAMAILRRLLPTYQPRLQEAQARERAHRDAVAQQEVITTLLAQMPGCTARHTPGQARPATIDPLGGECLCSSCLPPHCKPMPTLTPEFRLAARY
jgi:hypothetical protein